MIWVWWYDFQVNLEGSVHALQVLEAANPYIKVISNPVEYLGALWLPFRRDHLLIEQAVQQHGQINAIFAHLDIVIYTLQFFFPYPLLFTLLIFRMRQKQYTMFRMHLEVLYF